MYLQINNRSFAYYEFLANVVITGFRIIVNLLLCYIFVAISLKKKNAIFQIDSLGNILIVKPANSNVESSSGPSSGTTYTSSAFVSSDLANKIEVP